MAVIGTGILFYNRNLPAEHGRFFVQLMGECQQLKTSTENSLLPSCDEADEAVTPDRLVGRSPVSQYFKETTYRPRVFCRNPSAAAPLRVYLLLLLLFFKSSAG